VFFSTGVSSLLPQTPTVAVALNMVSTESPLTKVAWSYTIEDLDLSSDPLAQTCAITDLAGFRKIMRETAMQGLVKTSQDWVRQVIFDAVYRNIMDPIALTAFHTVPRTGSGVE